jgi:DNA-binding GntR family transcriptional regulator
MAPSRIAQTALYQEVAERLRQRIFAHELPPGIRIDEQLLTVDYGISRTPLREALKVLAAEGLVTLTATPRLLRDRNLGAGSGRNLPLMAMLEGRCALEATKAGAAGADRQNLRRSIGNCERFAAATRSSVSSRPIRSFTSASRRCPKTAGCGR